MKNSILSIIIPVYNVECYIDKCLDSIISQICNGVEVILVNDGSTDSSKEICHKYEYKYDFIKLVSQSNQGLSEARNTGIKYAQGDYLLFLDSDDYIANKSLAIILNDIKAQNADINLGRSFKFNDGDDNFSLCQIDYAPYKGLNPCQCFKALNAVDEFWFAAWLVIIRRSFLINNNLYFKKGIYHEDELWVPSVFAKATSVALLNYGFYCYRLGRAGSIVYCHNIKREFDKLIVVDELHSLEGVSNEAKSILNQRCSSLVFGIVLSLVHFEKDNRYNELSKEIKSRLNFINCTKYRAIYIACHILGIKKTSKFLNMMFKSKIQNSSI